VSTVTRTAPVSDRATLASLARYETLRIARHPLMVTGTVLWVFLLATYVSDPAYGGAGYDLTQDRPNTSLDTPVAPAFLIGLLGLLAMNRITSSSGRVGDALEAAPVPEVRRTLALCVACLVPGAIGLAGSAYVFYVWMTDPPIYAIGWNEYSDAALAANLAAGVLACVGGPLLGVLVARWWRWPTAAAVTSVLLVLWAALSMIPGTTVLLSLLHHSSPFALVTGYAEPGHWHEGGNLFLRLGYLAGLCALAALGAVAHGTEGESRRRTARWVVAAAVVTAGLLVLTVVTGPESFYVEDPTWPLR
jgi:hypothetical protein